MNNINNQILSTNYVSGTILGTGIETVSPFTKENGIYYR